MKKLSIIFITICVLFLTIFFILQQDSNVKKSTYSWERDLKTIKVYTLKDDEYDVFKKLVWNKNLKAIDYAFFMLKTADGSLAEWSNYVIGNLIEIDASLFLKSIKKHNVTIDGGLVGNLGPDLVDKFDLQRKKIELRIQILQNVIDEDILKERDACVKLLLEQLNTINDVLGQS